MPTFQILICLSLSAVVDRSQFHIAPLLNCPTQLYIQPPIPLSIYQHEYIIYWFSTLQNVTFRATEKEKNVQTVGSLLNNINPISLIMQIAQTVRLFGLV